MFRSVSLLTASVVLASLAATASAETFVLNGITYTTEFNTGSGNNHALMVLEYGSNQYAFGYSWGAGTKTGLDMLQDIAGNSSGSMSIVSYIDYQFGDPATYIEAINYLDNEHEPDYPNSWFNYFNSDSGSNWVSPWDGAADRFLSDGSADAWVWQNLPADPNTWAPQITPQFDITVPEPASLAVLGLGALSLIKRKTRR